MGLGGYGVEGWDDRLENTGLDDSRCQAWNDLVEVYVPSWQGEEVAGYLGGNGMDCMMMARCVDEQDTR